MKITFIKQEEIKLDLEKLLKLIMYIIGFNDDYNEKSLKNTIIDILNYKYDYEYDFRNFDNTNEKIDVIIKNLELYCVENNLTHQLNILRKYNY